MAKLSSVRSVEAMKDVGYHHCGPGLYLQVSPSGTKSWIYRFKSPITKKQREMGLGSQSVIGLAEVGRQIRTELKLIEQRFVKAGLLYR